MGCPVNEPLEIDGRIGCGETGPAPADSSTGVSGTSTCLLCCRVPSGDPGGVPTAAATTLLMGFASFLSEMGIAGAFSRGASTSLEGRGVTAASGRAAGDEVNEAFNDDEVGIVSGGRVAVAAAAPVVPPRTSTDGEGDGEVIGEPFRCSGASDDGGGSVTDLPLAMFGLDKEEDEEEEEEELVA